MSDWRLVCPLGRLPQGRSITALLEGERVLVVREADGVVRAVCDGHDPAREHPVRVRHGIVEVALRPELVAG